MEDNVKNKFWEKKSILIVFAVLILFIAFYFIGWKISSGFKIGKSGRLTIEIPVENTNIFINENKKYITKAGDTELTISLLPKTHSIIVSHENYFPWKKDVEIEYGEHKKITPLFVAQSPSGNIIGTNDSEYWKIYNNIKNNFSPTNKNKAKILGGVSVWVEENTIFASTTDKIIDIIKPLDKIKNLDFYKNRNDALIFSAGQGVYVVEIEKNGTQNFMPIYKGENPEFLNDIGNFIYVLDGNLLMQVLI